MSFTCGIIGLPNVGKSTIFNALTSAKAASENFPFCTIEPNIGDVAVPNPRLFQLVKIASSKVTIPTRLSFVDIAGQVRGASKGEGLGNQFLATIREVDAIIHVLRCFEDSDVTHVEGNVDPLRDAEIIEIELMLSDLESLEKRLVGLEKKARSGEKEAKYLAGLMRKATDLLEDGKPARVAEISKDDRKAWNELNLLTSKPILYVCNVEEEAAGTGNEFSQKVVEKAKDENAAVIIVSAAIEEEVAQLDKDERVEFLETLGLQEAGLDRLIRTGYDLLTLITYFTVGPKEARAWTIREGTKAPKAAGTIHTDFEKGFIRAETIAFDEFVNNNGEAGSKEAGKMRLEGKEYVVADGDVMHFRFAN